MFESTFSIINLIILVSLAQAQEAQDVGEKGKTNNYPLLFALKNQLNRTEEISAAQPIQFDVTEIISLFDNIEASLQNAISVFEGNNASLEQKSSRTRKVRNFKILGARSQCAISKDKLIGLKNEITNTLNNVDTTQAANTCEIDSSNSDNCNEMMKLIQCGVSQLKDGFTEATKGSASLDEITKYKNAYDEMSEKYNRGIDDAKRSASQEAQHALDQLKTSLQGLGSDLNIKVEQLKKKIQELCISEIHSGRSYKAFEAFSELKDDSKLSAILMEAYDRLSDSEATHAKLNNVDKILQFIFKLTDAQQLIIAYQTLFDAMKRNNHLDSQTLLLLDSQKLLLLEEALKDLLDNHKCADLNNETRPKGTLQPDKLARANEITEHLQKKKGNNKDSKIALLSYKLAPHVTKIITDWARAKDYAGISRYARKSDITSDNVRERLSQIIQIVYGNLNEFDTILDFLSGLPSIPSEAVGYTALLSEMYRFDHVWGHSEVMTLAYKVKRAMENNSYDNISENHKNMFRFLKNSLPYSVQTIIWSATPCSVKSSYFNEYLYAASDDLVYDEKRRNVYTYRKGDAIDSSRWQIETSDSGNTFSVKCSIKNEYLFPGLNDMAEDSKRRKLFTWREGGNVAQGYYKFEPLQNSNSFKIKSVYWNEYLYAGSNFYAYNERRNVYTWRSGGDPGLEGEWLFNCR